MKSIDTLSILKELVNGGFTQSQAEAQTNIFKRVIDAQQEILTKELEARQLATKGDIHKLELKIESTKSEILYWLIGSFLATVGVLITLFQIYRT